MKRFVIAVGYLFWWFLVTPAGAQLPEAPVVLTTPGFEKYTRSTLNFLKVGQSARAVGMGEAYTTISDDINAIFYNPAGLTHIKHVEYMFSYTRWLVDSKFFASAIGVNIGNSFVVGISVVRFSPEEFEETTVPKPLGTGRTVKAGDIAVGVAYAKKFTNKLSMGLDMKYVQSTLHTKTLKTLIFDVGTFLYTGFRSSRISMALKNMGRDVTLISETNIMPIYFNVGGAMEVYGKKGDPACFTLSFESAYAAETKQRFHLGGEAWFANTLALRAGYKFNYDRENYTLGGGVKKEMGNKKVTADFSYTGFGEHFDAPMRFSVGFAF